MKVLLAFTKARLLLLLAAWAMVTGCSLFSNNTAALLWTDRPELAVYSELYNAETSGRKIEVIYKEIPWLAIEREDGHPDLVAGTRLNSVSAIRNFHSLETMIRKEKLDPTLFYSDLFDLGCFGEKCLLVPVSFTLPAVIFMENLNDDLSDEYIISYKEMRMLSNEFNVFEERPTQMGYSPRWQPDFIYYLSKLIGAEYYESDSGITMWNDVKIQEALTYAADWIDATNQGHESEDFFKTKYMYDPMYKLLNTQRILFSFIMIHRFLSVPSEVRDNLGIRWLSDNSKKIAVGDDVLFIGIPKQAKQKKTAESFISWLCSYETQVKLLESAQFDRMRFFGVAGGLSSLPAVNTDAIPRFFPFLLGHIPHGNFLDFPKRLPISWDRMKAKVIIPWFEDAVDEDGAAESLADSLAKWRLGQPALYR